MNEFENMKRELESAGKGAELEKLVKSSEAARIGKLVDANALKAAVAQGDSATLGKMLQQVLATDDGKALLKKVNENFGKK